MTSFPQRVADVELESVDGAFFAVTPGSKTVTWLNKTAAMVFLLCTGENSEVVIAETLRQLFDLSKPPIKDVQDTVSDLISAGLVTATQRPPVDNPHVYVVLWTPSVMIDTDVLTDCSTLLESLRTQNITTTLIVDRDQNLRRSRNRAASSLVVEGNATHLLFLDATKNALHAVMEMSVARAIESQHGLVGFPVVIGDLNWARVHNVARSMTELDVDLLSASAHSYDVHFGKSSSPPNSPRVIRDGYIHANSVSSSALLVTRSALEIIAGSNLTNAGRGLMVSIGAVAIEKNWGFFDPISSLNAIDLGEDTSFCERWRATGGSVMVDTTGGFGLSLKAALQQRDQN